MKIKYFLHSIFTWDLIPCSCSKCSNYTTQKNADHGLEGNTFGSLWFCSTCVHKMYGDVKAEVKHELRDKDKYVLKIWYEYNAQVEVVKGSWDELLEHLKDNFNVVVSKKDTEYTIMDKDHRNAEIIVEVIHFRDYFEPIKNGDKNASEPDES